MNALASLKWIAFHLEDWDSKTSPGPDCFLKTVRETAPLPAYHEFFTGSRTIGWVDNLIKTARQAGSRADVVTYAGIDPVFIGSMAAAGPDIIWISINRSPGSMAMPGKHNGLYQNIIEMARAVKSQSNSAVQLGISYWITPQSWTQIADFITKLPAEININHLSIEFDLYLNQAKVNAFEALLYRQFAIDSAPVARTYLRSPGYFKDCQPAVIEKQIETVREYCLTNNIEMTTHPKSCDQNTIRHYCNEEWEKIAEVKPYCSFPLIFAAVSSRGSVTVCGDYYELSAGNIVKQGLINVLKSEAGRKIKKFLRRNRLPVCTACTRYYE